MKKLTTMAAIGLLAVGLAACQTADGQPNNQAVGTGIGALGGALVGGIVADRAGVNPVVGALIGGVAGGLIGNAIGAALDEQEREQLALASLRAAESARVGQRVAWSVKPAKRRAPRPVQASSPTQSPAAAAAANSPDAGAATAAPRAGGATGYVVAKTERYQAADGSTCRDLHQVAVKDGKTVEQDVTACRGTSGWAIRNA